MDTPAHVRDYQDLLMDTELLGNINLNHLPLNMGRLFHETLGEIQSRLDRLRTIALLRSIPELVQAPPPVHAPRQPLGRTPPPDTPEPPFLTPGQLSPLESPQSDRQTEEGISFRDALNEIQQRLDNVRTTALLRGIVQPRARVPLHPLSTPSTLSNRPESSGQPRPVSQDEMVIRQRGHKRLRMTWSPAIDLKGIASKSADRTPSKVGRPHHVSQKAAVNLRAARRKRLRFW